MVMNDNEKYLLAMGGLAVFSAILILQGLYYFRHLSFLLYFQTAICGFWFGFFIAMMRKVKKYGEKIMVKTKSNISYL